MDTSPRSGTSPANITQAKLRARNSVPFPTVLKRSVFTRQLRREGLLAQPFRAHISGTRPDALTKDDAIPKRIDHAHVAGAPLGRVETGVHVLVVFIVQLAVERFDAHAHGGHDAARGSVAVVLGEPERDAASRYLHEERRAGFEAVFEVDAETEVAEEELARLLLVEDPQQGDHLIGNERHGGSGSGDGVCVPSVAPVPRFGSDPEHRSSTLTLVDASTADQKANQRWLNPFEAELYVYLATDARQLPVRFIKGDVTSNCSATRGLRHRAALPRPGASMIGA